MLAISFNVNPMLFIYASICLFIGAVIWGQIHGRKNKAKRQASSQLDCLSKPWQAIIKKCSNLKPKEKFKLFRACLAQLDNTLMPTLNWQQAKIVSNLIFHDPIIGIEPLCPFISIWLPGCSEYKKCNWLIKPNSQEFQKYWINKPTQSDEPSELMRKHGISLEKELGSLSAELAKRSCLASDSEDTHKKKGHRPADNFELVIKLSNCSFKAGDKVRVSWGLALPTYGRIRSITTSKPAGYYQIELETRDGMKYLGLHVRTNKWFWTSSGQEVKVELDTDRLYVKGHKLRFGDALRIRREGEDDELGFIVYIDYSRINVKTRFRELTLNFDDIRKQWSIWSRSGVLISVTIDVLPIIHGYN